MNPASGRETLLMLMGIFEAARVVPRSVPSLTLPLTIISGFLGAGKTTLVNRLLSDPGGRRIAVLVNDFAAVNIDEELIRFQSGDTIGLTNGCACCSINGDLVNAIQRLVERNDPPDAVILEASGVADPRGIAQVALANPAIGLDAVVTLVDAETLSDRIEDERTRPILTAQLSAADIVAINKVDLVGIRKSQIRDMIERIAPKRVLFETTYGNIPSEIVLGAGKSSLSMFASSPADHPASFSSMTWVWKEPVERDAFLQVLSELPSYVIRAKGTISFKDDADRKYIYQRVGTRETLDQSRDAMSDSLESKLVLIGFSESWNEAEISALLA